MLEKNVNTWKSEPGDQTKAHVECRDKSYPTKLSFSR